MRLIISESDSVKFRLPVPSSAVIFILRTALKQNQDIPPEMKKQIKEWLRRCKPLLKAYRGYPIGEVREKDGTELVITL